MKRPQHHDERIAAHKGWAKLSREGQLETLTKWECERRGWECRIVRAKNRVGKSQDLLGMFDALAFGPMGFVTGTYAIQLTDQANFAARRTKVVEHPDFPMVRKAGWRVLIFGWYNNNTLREVEV